MLCYLRALLFKNSWYHYVILQRWGRCSLGTSVFVGDVGISVFWIFFVFRASSFEIPRRRIEQANTPRSPVNIQ